MGTGEAELKPDFARINVTVATQAETVAQATAANNTATERVLARIQGLGIKREDIRTANFQVFQTPQQVGPDGKEVKTPKFSAHHRLQITTRDLDGVGRLAGEILASGDMTFQSVSFGLDRQEEGGDKAREAAVRDARRQAEVYANGGWRRLGPSHRDPRRLGPALRAAAGHAHVHGDGQGRRDRCRSCRRRRSATPPMSSSSGRWRRSPRPVPYAALTLFRNWPISAPRRPACCSRATDRSATLRAASRDWTATPCVVWMAEVPACASVET